MGAWFSQAGLQLLGASFAGKGHLMQLRAKSLNCTVTSKIYWVLSVQAFLMRCDPLHYHSAPELCQTFFYCNSRFFRAWWVRLIIPFIPLCGPSECLYSRNATESNTSFIHIIPYTLSKHVWQKWQIFQHDKHLVGINSCTCVAHINFWNLPLVIWSIDQDSSSNVSFGSWYAGEDFKNLDTGRPKNILCW